MSLEHCFPETVQKVGFILSNAQRQWIEGFGLWGLEIIILSWENKRGVKKKKSRLLPEGEKRKLFPITSNWNGHMTELNLRRECDRWRAIWILTTVEFLPPLPVGAMCLIVHSGHICTDCGEILLRCYLCDCSSACWNFLHKICLQEQRGLCRGFNSISRSWKTFWNILMFFLLCHLIIAYVFQKKNWT